MRARRSGSSRPRSVLADLPREQPASSPRASRLAPPRAIGRLPLVAALVPDPDVWRVAGAGRTLVARRRADGRIAWASLSFDLKRPAEMRLFGNLESDEGAFEEILDALFRIDDAPPMVGGSDSLAARFTRGALAYARDGAGGPADEPDLLAVFDRGQGHETKALESFAGRDGLCPPDLLEICREEASADLPPGQGLATQVCLGFRVVSTARLRASVARDGDFVAQKADGAFAWQPHSLGGADLGSIQFLGDGRSHSRDELEAETVSLDLAGRLCARIKRHAEGAVELVRLARRPIQ